MAYQSKRKNEQGADKTSRPDKKISREYYNSKLTEYAQDVRALGWGNIRSQEIRFRVLSEIGDFKDKSILDVGCGFGDFYGFLKRVAYVKSYLGIDIHQKMLDEARKRYPEAKFEIKDILEDSNNDKFDYIVASGIFGLETINWDEITQKMISRMYELSNVGVSVNFLSSFTNRQTPPHAHYANPLDMLNYIIKNLSTRVTLRHDYMPNDFTIYIYKPFV